MNRRTFLSALAASVAGAAFDPERLLWVPGQKTIVDLAGPRFEPLVWRALYAKITLVRQFGSAGFDLPDGWQITPRHGDLYHDVRLTDAALQAHLDRFQAPEVLEVMRDSQVRAILTHNGDSFERLREDV